MKDPYSVPQNMQEIYTAVTDLTDSFCREKLNEEYADMCQLITARLCRKRPSRHFHPAGRAFSVQ
jgi:hypothetical protein